MAIVDFIDRIDLHVIASVHVTSNPAIPSDDRLNAPKMWEMYRTLEITLNPGQTLGSTVHNTLNN